MSRILIKGTQITVPNAVGAASSFSEETVVRLANPSSNDRLVTVAESNSGISTIGTFTILADTTELLEKILQLAQKSLQQMEWQQLVIHWLHKQL